MIDPVFVGRQAELDALLGALARAREGAPATVLVGGEAGIGKSRLVEELMRRAGPGVRVLAGGCVDLGADDLPFAPLTAALRGLLDEIGADGVRELLPGAGVPELARLLPPLGPAATPEPGSRQRLFEEVLALLAGLGRAGPAVLVVEDAHWADRSSRELLDFLVRSQRAAPGLLLLVTYRTDDLDRAHPLRALLAQLGRVTWVERLALTGLPRRDVAAQLRARLGREPEPALLDAVLARSQGNPLFVESLVDEADDAVPDSLRDLLLAPVRRLHPATQQLLLVAAIGGVRLPHALLAAVAGLDEGALDDRLRPAVGANVLVVDGDAYAFRHALIRDAVADEGLPGERVRLHTAYAEALEAHPRLLAPGRAGIEAAHHWFATYDRPQALESAWRAAADAGALLAFAERLHLLDRVLDLWKLVPDAAGRIGLDRAALLETAVETAVQAGQHERAEALAAEALAEVDAAREPGRAAALHERRGFARFQLGRAGDVDDLRDSLRLVAGDPPARARLEAVLALRLVVVPLSDESRAAAKAALAGDALAKATALIVLAVLDARRGDDLRAQLGRLREARTLGGRDVTTRAVHWECTLLEAFGQGAEAAALAAEALREAAGAGLGRSAGVLHATDLASALAGLGRWDEALEVAGAELDRAPPAGSRTQLLRVVGSIRLARGDLDAAAAAVADAVEAAPARDVATADEALPLVRLEAELRLAEGRPEAARALLEPRLAAGAGAGLGWSAAWPLLLTAARAGCSGTPAAAASRPAVGPLQLAHQLTVRAELDGDTRAWRAAVAAWEAFDDPFGLAQALLGAARATLAADGHRAEATTHLRRAAELADRLGAAPLRERIGRLGRRARVDLGAGEEAEDDPARRLGLTARELDVLRLVAAGRGNRQIADELFISPKTASVHVSNILAKLSVAGRGEAAAAAHRLGLVEDAP